MQPGRRKTVLFSIVGVAAAAAGAIVGALVVPSRNGAAQLLGTSFVDLEGRSHRLVDWQGKALVCNFWATWCAPCREEVPLLVAAKQQYGTQGLEIIGIGIDHADKIREFAGKFGINYQLLIAGTDAIDLMRHLGNAAGALPFTVLIDRAGRLAGSRLGAFHREELDGVLAALLG